MKKPTQNTKTGHAGYTTPPSPKELIRGEETTKHINIDKILQSGLINLSEVARLIDVDQSNLKKKIVAYRGLKLSDLEREKITELFSNKFF